jgi:ATP-dependent helicase/nuclease subunit A
VSAATGGAYPPTPAQRRAADPRRSVWVAANAGTGKTRVLADRVLRLLLAGAHPESILCITFTRAGAAEMGERIERRLAAWAVERDQGKLRADLEHLTGEPPSDLTFARARKLFAQVLDLSHGLRIMTIHALCQTLLKRFPLEAEVAPHFETIDDRTAEELKAEARGIVLAERCRDDKDLGRAVELLAVTLAESTLSGAIAEMLAQRHRLTAAFARHCERGTCAGLLRHIDGLLEVEAGVEPPHLVRRACADGVYDADGLLHLANTFRAGGKRQQEAALSIATWLGRTASDRHELYEGYRTAFFTKDGQPRGNVLSAAFRRDRPDVARLYDREQARLGAVRDQIQALTLSRRTAALLRLGHAVIDAYEGLKRRSALLDFDDLVERTRVLLSTPGRKEWVLYKLDQRLDHVLVDEAQDTSPSQWGVVEQLTEEFVAGAGARGDAPRTLFIVGDEKQSIYSFQGADLANFRRVRARLLGHAEAAGLTFGAEALDVSFRTSRAVLEVVDRVLALPEMAGAVTDPAAEAVLHATSRKHHAGLVELWPLADHEDGGPEPTAWPLPDRPRVADEPERRVAGAIAAKLRGWFEAGEVLERPASRSARSTC